MYISTKDWKAFISRLTALEEEAGGLMQKWVQKNGFGNTDALISYAYALVQKYGEGSAALAAEMCDAIADMQGAMYDPAEAAEVADYGEVAKTMHGILKRSRNPTSVAGGVTRLVKQAGADTTIKHAIRTGAEAAWIPQGDTCAFCLTLASRGWQRVSKRTLKNGHAEHIHPHCDCTYAVRYDSKSGVEGYDPDEYLAMYRSADGYGPKGRINAMRRMHYEQNKDAINAQKRAAYALRQGKK